jgi:uncharacterized delta-60 repeat protein
MQIHRQLIAVVAFLCCLVLAAEGQTPGRLDVSFDAGAGVKPDSYSDVALGSDGKAVIIGGYGPSGKILRLHPDGSLDRAFAVSTGFGQQVNDEPVSGVVQADLKIVVGGFFSSYEGTTRFGILRLNADGTLDTAYNPGAQLQRANDASVFIRQLVLQPDGKVVARGSFAYTGADGVSRQNLARFNADGTLDSTFRPALNLAGNVSALAVGPAGQIVLSYSVITAEGVRTVETVRLLANGARDPDWDDGGGATSISSGEEYPVSADALAVQADGSVLIGGRFDKFNGVARPGLARLTRTGALDPDFVPAGFRFVFTLQGRQTNWVGDVETLRVVDGKVLVAGTFTHIGSPEGPARRGLARLNANGSLDEPFNVGGQERLWSRVASRSTMA